VLPPILLTGLGTLSMSCAHAAARPLVGESLLVRQHQQRQQQQQQAKKAAREQRQAREESPAIQPDGFVDGGREEEEEQEEEEVAFVQPKSAFAEQQKCGLGKPTRRAL
jgi:hypothetical protein